jgi:TonB family protein
MCIIAPIVLSAQGIPKQIHKVTPAYPDVLRQQGVHGQVKLEAEIDEHGIVQAVKVAQSLHPYLDYVSVQAVRQWRFEPVVQNGKPASAILTLVVNFDPETYRTQEESLQDRKALPVASGTQDNLPTILDRCAEYCQILEASALDYICVEKINDVFYRIVTKEELDKSGVVLSMVDGTGIVSTLASPFTGFRDKKQNYKNSYVSDYLLIKRGEKVEDKRILLKMNSHKVLPETPLSEGKRFSVFMPFLAPVLFLGKERQPLFAYKLLKDDRINGKDSYMVEAKPKSGDAGGIEHARIWVEKKTYRIIKIENSGIPIEGYESLLKEVTVFNIKPVFITTYSFEAEKKGLAFPSSLTIRADYPSPFGPDSVIEKLHTVIQYSDYKFFSIETRTDLEKIK